jgi:hypothetical protein
MIGAVDGPNDLDRTRVALRRSRERAKRGEGPSGRVGIENANRETIS